MTDTARGHLERALAWMTTYKHDDLSVDTRIATARAEVEHALWLLAIPPREEDQRDAERYRWLRDGGDETWTALGRRWPRQDAAKLDAAIDAAIADKEGK